MTPREIALRCASLCSGIGSMLKREDKNEKRMIHALHDTGAFRCAEVIRAFAATLPDEGVWVPREKLINYGLALDVLATMLDKAIKPDAGEKARAMKREISALLAARPKGEGNG